MLQGLQGFSPRPKITTGRPAVDTINEETSRPSLRDSPSKARLGFVYGLAQSLTATRGDRDRHTAPSFAMKYFFNFCFDRCFFKTPCM